MFPPQLFGSLNKGFRVLGVGFKGSMSCSLRSRYGLDKNETSEILELQILMCRHSPATPNPYTHSLQLKGLVLCLWDSGLKSRAFGSTAEAKLLRDLYTCTVAKIADLFRGTYWDLEFEGSGPFCAF